MKVITKKNVMVNGKFTEPGVVVEMEDTLAKNLASVKAVELIEEPKKEKKLEKNEDGE